MSIAILYIATGPYIQFWGNFYSSSERYFLPKLKKHYFIFTDCTEIQSFDNITVLAKSFEGFPFDSLFRFKYFLSIKEQLKNFDFIFYFNSNMEFIDDVGDELLPGNDGPGLIGVLHPGYFNKCFLSFPFERNKFSKAYIPFKFRSKYHYFMGGLNGGRCSDYLRLIETCYENIESDFSDGIIAKFHDESHLNQYLFSNSCKILGPVYGWQEGIKTKCKIKILVRDKIKHNLFYKKQPTNFKDRVLLKMKHLISTFFWVLFSFFK